MWTFLKGEKVVMCWFWTICLHAHSQHASLHLCLCPSVLKSRGSWALWNRRTWVHLPTCISGIQSSSSRMLLRSETSLPCAHTSLRMLVWPTRFCFPVTGQKHFCLCIMNIALMICSAALDYIHSGQKMRHGSSWWLEEHLSVPIYLLIFVL